MISEGENIKKIFIIVGIITLFAVAGFGVCGYLKAQEVKERGQAMGQIAAGTLNLETLKQDQTEISLLPWKNLSENSTRILKELETVIVAPDDLREKVGEFYSARAKDKYVEAQYLEVLIDVQRKLDLKNQQPKSKSQVDAIFAEFNNMQNTVGEKNLSLGPKFNTLFNKAEQEAMAFKNSLSELSIKMNDNSPSVQLSSAGLDKAIDELKQEIANSLNEWVDLQNDIKKEVSDLANCNWVNPLKSFE